MNDRVHRAMLACALRIAATIAEARMSWRDWPAATKRLGIGDRARLKGGRLVYLVVGLEHDHRMADGDRLILARRRAEGDIEIYPRRSDCEPA